MNKLIVLTAVLVYPFLQLGAQPDTAKEKKEILQVVQQFFDAMEKRDTVAFGNTGIADMYSYSVWERNDSVLIGSRPVSRFKQSLAVNNRIVKEKMRSAGVHIQLHKRIAMVWAPYDLWIDEKFTHCGVDVFTLLKTKDGWKIASIAYSVEPGDCDKEIK